MRRTISQIFLPLFVAFVCIGCSNEDMHVEVPQEKGVLCLRLATDVVYIQTSTRASKELTDWSELSFTIDNGSGPAPISFLNGEASIEAGTYTLSATNATFVDNGYAAALHSGSVGFTIGKGERKSVTLDLGKPKNAKVTLSLADTFSDAYDLQSLTLNDGARDIALTAAEQVVYLPATNTTINYTLVANAKAGTHVQDITGATGSVSIEPGKHTTLTLNIQPITGLVTIESGSQHSGEFQ